MTEEKLNEIIKDFHNNIVTNSTNSISTLVEIKEHYKEEIEKIDKKIAKLDDKVKKSLLKLNTMK